MRLPSVISKPRSTVMIVQFHEQLQGWRQIKNVSLSILQCSLVFNILSDLSQRLINVDASGSVMIMVITSREPHDYDCKTSQFSLYFISLIQANLQLSKLHSSLPTQHSKTNCFQHVLGLTKPRFKQCLHLPNEHYEDVRQIQGLLIEGQNRDLTSFFQMINVSFISFYHRKASAKNARSGLILEAKL